MISVAADVNNAMRNGQNFSLHDWSVDMISKNYKWWKQASVFFSHQPSVRLSSSRHCCHELCRLQALLQLCLWSQSTIFQQERKPPKHQQDGYPPWRNPVQRWQRQWRPQTKISRRDFLLHFGIQCVADFHKFCATWMHSCNKSSSLACASPVKTSGEKEEKFNETDKTRTRNTPSFHDGLKIKTLKTGQQDFLPSQHFPAVRRSALSGSWRVLPRPIAIAHHLGAFVWQLPFIELTSWHICRFLPVFGNLARLIFDLSQLQMAP